MNECYFGVKMNDYNLFPHIEVSTSTYSIYEGDTLIGGDGKNGVYVESINIAERQRGNDTSKYLHDITITKDGSHFNPGSIVTLKITGVKDI